MRHKSCNVTRSISLSRLPSKNDSICFLILILSVGVGGGFFIGAPIFEIIEELPILLSKHDCCSNFEARLSSSISSL